MGLYALFLIGGSTVGPIIAGFINDSLGYKWVFFIPAILCGVAFVFMLFFMEETNYARKTAEVGAQISSSGDIINTDEKSVQQLSATPTEPDASESSMRPSTKSFWRKMALFGTPTTNHMWTMFQNQIRFATFPVVLFSGFEYGLALVWAVVLGTTTSEILSAAPYNFS